MATLTPNKVTPDAPDSRARWVTWLWIAGGILAVLIVIPIMMLIFGRGAEDGTTTTTQAQPTVATTLAGSEPTTPTTAATPTTAGPTTPTTTPVTTIPSTTVPPTTIFPGPGELVYDVHLDALVATPLSGTVVVFADYGDGTDQVGLGFEDDGPCCFDVFSRDGVVLLDSQNLRLMRFELGEQPLVLTTFDASDLIPDALAVFHDSVVMVGLTTRTTAPYDVLVVSLDTGEVLERGPVPTIDINGDLRATSDGVFWSAPSSEPQWTALVDDDGQILDPEAQVQTNELPGSTTLQIAYDAGIEVQIQPPGDAPLTVYDVIAENALFADVFRYSGYTDGAIVMIGGEFDASVAPITLIEMGTNNAGTLETTAHGLEVERWSTTGSFGTFRAGFGSFWALNTGSTGIEIVRYDLN